MKLYVWNNPYPVAYGSSILFAVADDLEQAKLVALGGARCQYGRVDSSLSVNENMVADLGAPSRILELPCAEWHQWSE